jgi:endonuclease/exonuclease/phosphatase family metal-dependent hydrolase
MMPPMRLLSYNILDGGTGRADLLAKIIAAQRPDLVGLVEAEDEAVLHHLARRLKMDVLFAPGNTHASALLSRWPVRESINHAPLYKELEKSFLEAAVLEPAGQEWTLAVIHLHAHGLEADEELRMRELEFILKALEPHRVARRPHLLCGDFNANAAYQKIDPQKCKPRTRREWEQNGGGLPRRAVQRVLDSGYVDTLREVDPVAAQTLGTFTTEFPGQRVDYIFAFGIERQRLKHAWVEQSDMAKKASDHFPVGVEVV